MLTSVRTMGIHIRGSLVCRQALCLLPDSARLQSLLVSFSNVDGPKHYFFSVGLYGGSAVHRLTLPGRNKGPNKPCHCYVSDSVKGLFCFFNGRSLFVCNPATRNVQPIPKSLEYSEKYESVDSVFHKSYSAYAFGFDPSIIVFKILHVMGIQKAGMKFYDLQCEVYTVYTPSRREDEKPEGCHFSWQKIAHVPPYPYLFKSQGVYLNGFIYWLGMSAPAVESLVRFDVATETFLMISLATEISVEPNLTRVGERLALLGCRHNQNNNASSVFGLWRLDYDDNGSSWIKQSFEVRRLHKRLKLPVTLGNVSSGEMLLVADTPSQDYLLVPFHSNRATFRKLKIKKTGLPSFIEVNGVKHINFKITSHAESFVNVETRLLCFGYFLSN